MLSFPNLDPVLIELGPLKIRWYGLMYVFGFVASYLLVKKQLQEFKFTALQRQFENLNVTLILAIIIGGRLGYVVFYNLPYYLAHPLEIPATWTGGMSFHGAAIGLVAAGWLFCRFKQLDFWKAADIYSVTIPVGLGLGRIGNFINGELYGRVSTVPWAMVFPGGGELPRHPSQLYEALLEGLLLFIILWSLRRRPWRGLSRWPHGSLLALLATGYGVVRFAVEFYREPDPQLGLFFGVFSMGQILSSIMIIGGILLWIWRVKATEA